MRVTEQATLGQLSLYTRPNWAIALAGAILIVIGLASATLYGRLSTLSGERTGPDAGSFRLVEASLLGSHHITSIPLKFLRGASVAPHHLGGHPYFQLDLDLDDGFAVPYHLFWYASREAAQADADRLMAFRTRPELASVEIKWDRRPFFFGAGALFACFGAGFLLWGCRSLRATFDRVAGRVTVHQRSLLGNQATEYPVSAIAGLQVAGIRRDCNLFMVLEGGQQVALSASSDPAAFSGPRRVRAAHQGTAERINAFLAPGESSIP